MWRVQNILEFHYGNIRVSPRASLMQSLANIKSVKNLDQLAALYFIWNKLSRSGKTVEGRKPTVLPFEQDPDGRWIREHKNGWWTFIVSEVLTEFYETVHETLKVSVACQSWEQTLIDHAGCFAYLDPPYVVDQKLYTHVFTERDHRRFGEGVAKARQIYLFL